MRLANACFAMALVSVWGITLNAQTTLSTASNLGLESAWKSQVQMPRTGTGIVSTHLWAEPQNQRQFAVVELENRTIRVSAESLDKKGKPIGIEEAKKQAQQMAARLLGRNDGFQVVELSVPRIKLVVVTNDGLVQTLDAETGEVLWAQPCGNSNVPAFPGAVSPAGISVIHGPRVYLLDWETGKPLSSQKLRFSTSSAIAVCNDIAFVSDFTGRVQAYGLGPRKQDPWSYVMKGRAVGPTANLANQTFCAIASDAGFVYVFAGGEEPSVYIRYETTSPLTGSLTTGNDAFYAGTASGLVSKIALEDRLGTIKWEFRIGVTITAPPLVLGKTVYVASEAGDLVALDDETGIANWSTSTLGIRQPIAEAGGVLYGMSLTNELVAIDAETGVPQARTRSLDLSQPVVNQLNDRVYLISRYGQIQCLRPIGATLPTMVVPVVVVAGDESGDDSAAPMTGAAQTNADGSPFNFNATDPASGNPFGETPAPGAQPAGDPFEGSSNPFGEPDANPFGGGTEGESPFGTGDPFSGSGN